MKVVLDTNVLLSGLMRPGGTPGRIVAAWLDAHFEVAISHQQLFEIARVLAYQKIRRILNWSDDQIEQFITQLYIRAQVVEIGSPAVEVPRDPTDAPILATLTAAGADVLITGDADLLVLAAAGPCTSNRGEVYH